MPTMSGITMMPDPLSAAAAGPIKVVRSVALNGGVPLLAAIVTIARVSSGGRSPRHSGSGPGDTYPERDAEAAGTAVPGARVGSRASLLRP